MNPGMIILLYMLYSSTKKKIKKTSTAFKKPVFLSSEILNFKLSKYEISFRCLNIMLSTYSNRFTNVCNKEIYIRG